MEKYTLPLMILEAVLLSCAGGAVATQRCGDCGLTPVPYPLSTGPNCGDQLYKIRCNAGSLWFDSLNGSSYMINSIDQSTQRLTIWPAGLEKNKCMAKDLKTNGIALDDNLPFNITGSNTIMLMNCSTAVKQLSLLNCSSACVCHTYIRDNPAVAAVCGVEPICCSLKTGGSVNAYKIMVREQRCSAYQSFVNLDTTLPVKIWPEPGLEIEWALPKEPVCKLPADCRDLLYSICLPDSLGGGRRRCFCNAGFRWDPINGLCYDEKCQKTSGCHPRKKGNPLIGVTCAIALGVFLGILVYRRCRRIKREASHERIIKLQEDILNANNSGKSSRVFTGKEITRATNNFSKQNLLGSGGFGEVFKGILDDGTITAVKRAKLGNTKGTDQILNEVRILCQVNHRRLVRLLGCCIELDQPLMIYEYISNGTLFDHLHGFNFHKWPPLTWHRRLCIAHQTAEGLAYLHSSAVPPIYHRDIKTSNILLDENLDAKVTDFGLSRLVETNVSHISTCVQGTLGYLDPDYYLNFQLTDKSDVYSFGVVLLELLTSKKALDLNRQEEDVNLVVYVKRMVNEERLTDAVDPILKEGATKVEIETMNALGCLANACLDERRQNRPSMKEVADEIEYLISIITGEVSEG